MSRPTLLPARGPEETQVRVAGRRTATLVATATWLLGAGTVASALLPPIRGRLRLLSGVVPLTGSETAAAVAATLGVLLCYLAGGLRRRKRRAWLTAVAVTVVVALAHLAKGLDVEEAVASLAVLGLLLGTRREFQAEGDPSSRWLAVRRFVQLVAIGTGLGMLLLQAYRDRIVGSPSLGLQLRHVLLGLVGVTGPVRFTGDRSTDLVSAVLLGFGLLTALTTAYLVLRSAEPPAHLTAADEARLRALLDRHGGRDSLGYFALRRDKSAVFSATGKAALTYRVVHGVLLVSGDPIGDPEAWPGAIDAALELARRHAWVPAVIGAGERGATVWGRHGLDAYELGDEAVLDVPGFALHGRSMRGVRQAVSRIERAGFTAAVRRTGDIPAAELAELVSVAALWRGGGVERGFSMALSRIGDPADGDCVVVTAHQDGTLRGLLHFVPWGCDGLSLDLMRRDRTADNGLNEFLDGHARRGRAGARRAAAVAELRGAPLGAGAGPADRCRPGRAGLALGAGVGVAVVADRDAVPVQRQVQADLGAALPLLSLGPGAAPHRGRRARG